MEIEQIKHFEGRRCKLKLKDNFVLIGTILEVYKDSLLFKTDQTKSLIATSEIAMVVGL